MLRRRCFQYDGDVDPDQVAAHFDALTASTTAVMPALTDPGSFGQTSITCSKPESRFAVVLQMGCETVSGESLGGVVSVSYVLV